jgi:glycogen debranching enzyme
MIMNRPLRAHPVVCLLAILAVVSSVPSPSAAWAQEPSSLELSRPIRSWEFLSATGQRAGLLGNEAGRFEAWVYPLKILRDFHLRFHVGDREIPAEALARTLTVHPESSSILYASDTFSVRETLFVPVHETGAVILIDVDTSEPVDVEAVFHRDFQLEWPAALGGTYMSWNADEHAFVLGEEQNKYVALVGSPTAEDEHAEYQTSYSSATESSFRLGATKKGHGTKVVVIAASLGGFGKASAEAETEYRRLTTSYAALLQESAAYYRDYLARTVNLALPDEELQRAYDWSRVSMVQGLVANPFLGTGLVAGYRTSGESQRPGFAWFFGRDSEWTELGLDAVGDFGTTRTALDFLSQFQRDDGKVPHEIAQSASLVPWFKDYPYGFASADATPLFIIAMDDYIRHSGDIEFAKSKWANLEKAYNFLRSTYDAQGLPKNFGVGHGWIEGGPLLPVKTELYQSGVGAEALRALSNLARAVDKNDLSQDLARQFERQRSLVNDAFWSQEQNAFAFAIDNDDKRVPVTSVLSTVPMWFGLLEEAKAESTITQLATPEHQADWGMRIISKQNPEYGPDGYHYGAVWPLFTGWAATGEYRYHRAFPAYANLRANSLLGLDGSLGHVTEVLSGDYYQPIVTSSPHQIWSAAMVVNPLVRGLLGLDVDAALHHLAFAPHVPAGWNSFSISNLRVGEAELSLKYTRTADAITLESTHTGAGECNVDFAPAISLRAKVLGAELNGKVIQFHAQTNSIDQHVAVSFPACTGSDKLVVRLRNDFGLSLDSRLPALGAVSEGLRVVSESWSAARDTLTLEVSGATAQPYDLAVLNPGQVRAVEGGELVNGKLRIGFPAGEPGVYSRRSITFHFLDAKHGH